MPITKKAAPSVRKPSPPKRPVAKAPAPLAAGASELLDTDEAIPAAASVAATAVETAPSNEPPIAAAPAQEAVEEEIVDLAVAADPAAAAVEEVSAEPTASSASPNLVRLGHVEGVLHRVAVEVVQLILEEFQGRIDALRASAGVLALHQRVRETEGRCAPIVCTIEANSARPHLFAGLDHFAAALNVELTHVYVITVRADDAGAVQSYLVHRSKAAPVETEDDLVRQVLSYYG
jgi:hypothetical protein